MAHHQEIMASDWVTWKMKTGTSCVFLNAVKEFEAEITLEWMMQFILNMKYWLDVRSNCGQLRDVLENRGPMPKVYSSYHKKKNI